MKKISKRYYFLIGSLIFGMFFGAGNLIFPIHLGQLAGANWGKAAIGFLLSGVLLPLLSLLAIRSRVQMAFMILQNRSVQNMH